MINNKDYSKYGRCINCKTRGVKSVYSRPCCRCNSIICQRCTEYKLESVLPGIGIYSELCKHCENDSVGSEYNVKSLTSEEQHINKLIRDKTDIDGYSI